MQPMQIDNQDEGELGNDPYESIIEAQTVERYCVPAIPVRSWIHKVNSHSARDFYFKLQFSSEDKICKSLMTIQGPQLNRPSYLPRHLFPDGFYSVLPSTDLPAFTSDAPIKSLALMVYPKTSISGGGSKRARQRAKTIVNIVAISETNLRELTGMQFLADGFTCYCHWKKDATAGAHQVTSLGLFLPRPFVETKLLTAASRQLDQLAALDDEQLTAVFVNESLSVLELATYKRILMAALDEKNDLLEDST